MPSYKKPAPPAPMAHQNESLEHDATHPRIFDMSDAGTGKTAVRIWGFDARRKKGGGCLLVLATRTLLEAAWARDLRTFAPHLVYSIANAENRAEAFAVNADIYITNHDAAKWLAAQPASFFKKFSELVIDESTAYKHSTSQRSKAIKKIVKYFKRRALLTATPYTNGITNIWHQVLLLDDGATLGENYFAFRNATQTPTQIGDNPKAIHWADKPGAPQVVLAQMQDMVIRHKLEDCIDMPGNHKYSMEYKLPAKQMAIYREMEDEQLLVFRSKKVVSAVNAAVAHGKLLQIASGAVYAEDGSYEVLDAGRYEMVMDLVAERPACIVFFLWKHQKDELVKLATTRGLQFRVMDGTSTDRQRQEAVNAYQGGALDVLFAHPETAAHGLTFTYGRHIIWASPTYDLELYIQGSSRQHRIGQKFKCETLVVLAKGTKDEDAWRVMQGKGDRMAVFLEMAEQR